MFNLLIQESSLLEIYHYLPVVIQPPSQSLQEPVTLAHYRVFFCPSSQHKDAEILKNFNCIFSFQVFCCHIPCSSFFCRPLLILHQKTRVCINLPTILKNIFVFFSMVCKFKCNSTSYWLNAMV